MAAEAIALVGFATKASTFVQQTASTWYKPSKDMRKFKQKSIDLRLRSKYWASLLRKYNMDDSEIGSLLEYASQLLDAEDAKIKALESSSWMRRWWTTLVFPEELTEAMENLCSTFEQLPQRLAERGTTAQQLEKVTFYQRAPLKFASDKKYVELKVTMDAVQSALESETTGPVVTLCGGPGQGKTSMAIHLALVYQNRSIEDINPSTSVREEELQTQSPASTMLSWGRFLPCCDWLGAFLSQDASSNVDAHATLGVESVSSAQNLVSNRFTDGVFFYSCGPTANSKDVLFELWRDLGYQLLPPTTEAGQDESSIRKELIRRLANLKVLIVLDDVWERMFIEKLLVHGRWIKYLVTTQKPELWRDPNCEDILIENPTKEEAHKIVRNHVGGFPTDVTPEFEGAVDAFIEKSEQNPLVLVNMATFIRSQHASDLKEWESAGKYLEELVKDEDAQLATTLFGRTYSKRTMRASITMAVDSFSKQEQTLLVLASICEGESIPEVVFQLFFKSIHGRLGWFSRCSQNLENNNFIRIESKRVPWSNVPERSWSLHSMRQQVIGAIRDKDVTSLIAKLLDCNPKDKIVVALLALYGQRQWHHQATRRLMNLKESCHNDELELASSHFSTIKPFVWLLQLEGEEEWEKKSYDLVEQVVHEYLLAGQLDDKSLSLLLAMQQTILPTTEALTKMVSLKETRILNKRHPRTAQALLNLLKYVGDESKMVSSQSGWLLGWYSWDGLEDTIEVQSLVSVTQRLVALLDDNVVPNAQKNAAIALGGIFCFNELAHLQVASFLGSMERSLLALLAEDLSSDVQTIATWTLGHLSQKVPASAIRIALFPEAIERLLTLLRKEGNPMGQKWAAWSLGQLSCNGGAEISYKIATLPGTMATLVALLAEDVSPDVQEEATWALGSLASAAVESAMHIASFPEAIERLSALLRKEGNPMVQQWAAWTLGQLSHNGGAEISCKIAALPGTMATLVALLAEDVSSNVQDKATWALCSLASAAVESAMQIACFPEAIERLSTLLRKEGNPMVQKWAAWTLGDLSCNGGAAISCKIAALPDTMATLVALLAEDVSPDVQDKAASALGSLASAVVESAMQIASFPEAIDRLLALLRKEGNPMVQKWAAWTLARLSRNGGAEISCKIGALPGTMATLAALVAEDVSPDVLQKAAWALSSLASTIVESAMQIASFQEAIERLSALLPKEGSPMVQKCTAWTLAQLSRNGGAEIFCKIATLPGTMATLVALLGEDVSPDVQEKAAWALGNLASTLEESAMQIASFQEAIERLSALLCKEGSPMVQKCEAWTLAQLSRNGGAEISCKIVTLPGTMATLVALLGEDVSPDIQEEAAWALGSLASTVVERAMQIVSFPEAIERLSTLYSKWGNPRIRKCAAWTLGQLSRNGGVEITYKIAPLPDTMAMLVVLLGEKVSPNVQEKAAWALGSLASAAVESAMQIASFPKVIERLSALLRKESYPRIQRSAAWTLGQLSRNGGAEISCKIVALPGAMATLVALLGEDVSPNVQEKAAWALGSLASAAVESAMQIASFQEVIERLSTLLRKEGNPMVQKWAAWTLGQLSRNGGAEISCKIATLPGTMATLVALLAEDVSVDIQEEAAWAVGSLASTVVESAMQIASFPEAIGRLSALLRKEGSPMVQKWVAWTLGQLSRNGGAEISCKIGVVPGTMATLVALLGEDVSPNVQEKAAWALGCLASTAVKNAMKIASFQEVIERLSALLHKEGNPMVQQWAAWTLGHLSCNGGAEISCKIVALPGTMATLAVLLVEDVNPNVQEKAAWALGSLASTAVESAMQIASFPEVIERLSALCAKDSNPIVQKWATWALGKLVSQVPAIAIKIV